MHDTERREPDVSLALDGIVRDGLRPTSLAAALLYVAFAVADLTVQQHDGQTLFLTSAVTGALMTGIHFALRRWDVPASLAHPVLAVISAIVLANILLRLAIWDSPQHTAQAAVFLIAMGCLILSTRWLVATIIVTVLAWLAMVTYEGTLRAWLSMSYELIAGIVVASLVHYVRLHSYRRILHLRGEDARLRAQLEETISRLHETQRFNQQVANAAPYVLYIFDLVDRRNVFINQRVGELLGYSTAEIQQHGMQLVSKLVHPDDQPELQRIWSQAAKAADGEVIEGEYRVRHADGSWRWICTREVVFSRDPDGSVRSVLGSAHDVTLRRRSTTILHAITEGTVPSQGTADFGGLVRRFADALEVRAVLIAETRDAQDAHGLACWTGERLVEDFHYETAGSACERVLAGDHQHIAGNLRDAFRIPGPIAVSNAESYCGVPLLDSSGHVIGHLALIDDKPMPRNPADLPALQLCAARLAAELERRRADLALRESEERLRAVFENAALGIALIEPETPWRIIESNRPLQRMLGEAGVRLADQGFAALLQPEDRDRAIEKLRRLLDGGITSAQMEKRLRRTDGTQLWSRVDSSVLRDDAGRPALIVAIVEDITEQKRAEDELRFRTEFDRLITQISTQFVTADLSQIDGAIHATLERIGRFLGVDHSYLCRVRGSPVTISMTHEWCDDGVIATQPLIQNLPVDDFPWFWHRIRLLQPVLVSRVSDLPDEAGTVKAALQARGAESYAAVPIAFGTELWGYLGFSAERPVRTFSDETVPLLAIVGDLLVNSVERQQAEFARRESEARLRQILDNSTAVVFVKDLDGCYEFVNRAHEDVFHIPSASLRGKDDYVFLPPELADQVRENDRRVAEANAPLTIEEVVRHDDGPHTYLVVKFPLRGEDGRPYAICGIATDITDRKRAEEQIRTLNRDMQHAARLSVMGEMAAGLAHELHQPLAVIVNYARGCVRRLQKAEIPTPILIARLQEIADESIRAGRVIDKIRSFLQKREHERKPVELNPIVEDALQMARFDRRQLRVHVEFQAANDLPTVFADAVQVTQVLLNLILNAMQAMAGSSSDERKLTVTTRRHDEKLVAVSVADTGPGLSADTLARIFEQFFTTKPEGLGMGLAISRSIVQAHGGTMWYTTEPGAGTTFSFTLPVTSKLMEKAVQEMARVAAEVDVAPLPAGETGNGSPAP